MKVFFSSSAPKKVETLAESFGKNVNPSRSNYSSYLPDVYSGHPNRQIRYGQYDTMDSDSEVNAALDILAEFCSQINKINQTPFEVDFSSDATSAEIKVVSKYLEKWSKLNQFRTRMFKTFRNAIKYGDCFFIRDPETLIWVYVDPSKVMKIIVNESEGKEPEQYVIRDLNINLQNLTATQINPTMGSQAPGTTNYTSASSGGPGFVNNYASTSQTRFGKCQNEYPISAEHMIHLSMSEGLDNNFPFGNSVLESVFKVFKQKELIEDALLIYRIQRAPERRVFYIDVGNVAPHLGMAFLERVKNEINQRRIPSVNGGGNSIIDASYNPLSIVEDLFLPVGENGRGTKVEILPGGCLSMDTKVPLIDGRELTLQELTLEYQSGKTNWVFSTDPETGRIVPGEVSWAGITQFSAKVMKLIFSNGQELIVTPDHKFPILNRGILRADQLELGEVMIPAHIKREDDFAVYQNDEKAWCSTHDVVYSFFSEFDDKETYEYTRRPEKISDVRLIKVVPMHEKIMVGTLTIDQDETYHNYHNFALSAGVFTNNSNLGEINDLRHFSNKLFRALRIPSSYLPTGPEESNQVFTDGKVGVAYIQELRFNEYCKRLQNYLIPVFDAEFKYYLTQNGVNFDHNMFNLNFTPPQNFASYRQAEMDTTRLSNYSQIDGLPYLSKRFALKRFMGLSDEEIKENEMLWLEEQTDSGASMKTGDSSLRGAGITPGAIGGDLDNLNDMSSDDSGIPPEENDANGPGGSQTQSTPTPGSPTTI